jgi:glycosyltransferase involved in cell wall biosynthesis
MKIIVTVHQFLPDHSSGTEVIALGIARELQGRGHEVVVVTGYPDPRPLRDEERFDCYTYEGLRVERFRHSPDPMGDQSVVTELAYDNHLFARAFDRLLGEVEPDVVHFVHLARLSAALIGPCVERGIPTVFTATDFWPVCPYSQLRLGGNELCAGPGESGINCIRHVAANVDSHPVSLPGIVARAPNWMIGLGVKAATRSRLVAGRSVVAETRALVARQPFLRRELNRIDRVLAPSRLMERTLVEGGIDAERVSYLPYGIDVAGDAQPAERGRERVLRLGFIGSVAEHKGVDVAVEALRLLPPGLPVELSIHGESGSNAASQGYYARIRAQAQGDPRIRLCPPFPNREVRRVLASMDALVVPSVWPENTPLVVYEAFAVGCPVIGSDVEGIAEIVQHEVNGLLFAPGDSSGLASAVRRLAENRALLRNLAARTRQPLSVAAHVSKLEAIYGELTAVRAAGGRTSEAHAGLG